MTAVSFGPATPFDHVPVSQLPLCHVVVVWAGAGEMEAALKTTAATNKPARFRCRLASIRQPRDESEMACFPPPFKPRFTQEIIGPATRSRCRNDYDTGCRNLFCGKRSDSASHGPLEGVAWPWHAPANKAKCGEILRGHDRLKPVLRLRQHRAEAVEEVGRVVRAGGGFGVVLHARGLRRPMPYALDRAVVEVAVRHDEIGRQR